jgi:predicted Ser/Thr protein kinase
MDPVPPLMIGAFRIVRKLGEGAMSVVYLGERVEEFSQRVAIKMLHPRASLLFGEQLMHQEEKVLTSLDHPDIVRLLDTGDSVDGAHFIIMEYVEGVALDRFCSEHPLTKAQRVALLLQLTRAVDYAHRHLVVHGDLKPENILMTPEGQPKIIDFGIAILLGSAIHESLDAPVLLTPRFASPERLAGGRPTVASDLYSLGVVGRLLFANGSMLDPPVSRDLAAIFERATQIEPNCRYSSARQMADDIQAVLDHRPVMARPETRIYRMSRWVRRNRTLASMSALVFFVVIGSLLGVILQTARATYQRHVAQTRLHDVVRLTGKLQHELYDSVGPLEQGRPARASLRSAIHVTLDKLVAQQGDDGELALQIAQQYQSLALLEPDGSVTGMQTHRQALAELRQVSFSDPSYAAAQRMLRSFTKDFGAASEQKLQ